MGCILLYRSVVPVVPHRARSQVKLRPEADEKVLLDARRVRVGIVWVSCLEAHFTFAVGQRGRAAKLTLRCERQRRWVSTRVTYGSNVAWTTPRDLRSACRGGLLRAMCRRGCLGLLGPPCQRRTDGCRAIWLSAPCHAEQAGASVKRALWLRSRRRIQHGRRRRAVSNEAAGECHQARRAACSCEPAAALRRRARYITSSSRHPRSQNFGSVCAAAALLA